MRNLTIFSHKLFRRTPQGLQTTGAITLQIDALAPYFERVTVCAPVIDDSDFKGASVTQQNVHFHPLPHYPNQLAFLRLIPAMRREMLSALKNTDLALVILPGYAGVMASILCQRRKRPMFQWVVGDWGKNVKVRRNNRLTYFGASSLATPLLDRLMARLTRDTLTFYTGHILYHNHQPHQHVRISSSIRASDFYLRQATAEMHTPINLLFVGRLAREKGLSYLLEAIQILRNAEIPAILHLVGTGALERELQHKARELELENYVIFHGFVPHGTLLYQHYQNSDIFILPSLQEQQGKVLLEAMTQSLPVIASAVGGIPTVIQDGENGLLVSPANAQAIAEAVQRLIRDYPLRKKLIAGGLDYARAHTVEAEAAQMMRIVAQHFKITLEGLG